MRVKFNKFKYIITAPIAFLISISAYSQHSDTSDWTLGFFAAEKIKPNETGSKDYKAGKPGVGIVMTYQGKYRIYMMMFSCGAKMTIFSNDYFYLSTAIDIEPDDIFNIDDVYLLPSIEASASFLFLEASFSAEEQYSTFDSSHLGFSASTGAAIRAKITDSFKMSLTESITWSDAARIRNKFSIDDESSDYNPGPGFERLDTSFAAKWKITQNWEIKFGIKRGMYLEKALNSPAVQHGGGKTYWESKLMVKYNIPVFKKSKTAYIEKPEL